MNAARTFDLSTPDAETLKSLLKQADVLNGCLAGFLIRVTPVAEAFPREVSLTIGLVELQNMHKRLTHVRQRFQVLFDDSLTLDGPTLPRARKADTHVRAPGPRCECLTRQGTRCSMSGDWSREIADGRRVRICDLHLWRSGKGAELQFIPAPSSVPATAPAVPSQEVR